MITGHTFMGTWSTSIPPDQNCCPCSELPSTSLRTPCAWRARREFLRSACRDYSPPKLEGHLPRKLGSLEIPSSNLELRGNWPLICSLLPSAPETISPLRGLIRIHSSFAFLIRSRHSNCLRYYLPFLANHKYLYVQRL